MIHSTLKLTLLLGLLAPAMASAIPITTADGVGSDTNIRWRDGVGATEPDTNYGDATSVQLRDPSNPTISNARKIYLRFDLGAIADMSVTEVRLDMAYAGGDSNPFDSILTLWGLDDGDPGEDWGENTITWNNAPGNLQNSWVMDAARTTQLGRFDRGGDWVAGEVISFSSEGLVDFLNADMDGQVTLILTGTSQFQSSGIFTSFTSKESTSGNPPPTLEITAVPIPEPSTAVLLLLGLIALPGYKRR